MNTTKKIITLSLIGCMCMQQTVLAQTTYNSNVQAATTSNVSVLSTSAVKTVGYNSITLSDSELSFTNQTTQTLSASVIYYDNTYSVVTWSSSDTSVATVDENGVVTPIGNGTAVITATADTFDDELTVGCTVNVNFNATNITLNRNKNLSLSVGSSYDFDANVTPVSIADRTVTWHSSNPEVVSINEDGEIVCLIPGTSVITAITNDGSNLTASCTVTVKDLSRVTNLIIASNSKNSQTLSWTEVVGASEYEVFQYDAATGEYTLIGTTASTMYQVTGLSSGTSYKYKVRATMNANGTTYYGKYSTVTAKKTNK